MNFDELVDTVRVALQDKGDLVTVEDIHQILSGSGVAELIDQKTTADTPKRLVVRSIHLRGLKSTENQGPRVPFVYRRNLGTGMNIWQGSNDSGKSSILKCILWALTGEAPTIKADVRQWLSEIAIEFEVIGDQFYTVRFFPRSDEEQLTGNILIGTLDEVLAGTGKEHVVFTDSRGMKKAVSGFFGKLLGFSTLIWVKQQAAFSVDLSEQSMGWDVYSKAMFIGDDDYGDYLFPERSSNGKHHQQTLGMYLGLDLLEATSKAQAERDRSQNEYSFERRRVEANAAYTKDNIALAETQLQETETRLGRLQAGQSVLFDPSYVEVLGKRVSEYAHQITELQAVAAQLEAEFREIEKQLHEAERARHSLSEALRFKLFLSNLRVEICPRCEGKIETVSDEDEIHSRSCRVCHRELTPIASTGTQDELLAQAEARIKRLRLELPRLKKARKTNQTSLSDLNQSYEADRNELAQVSKQAQAGFSNELQELISQQGYLRGRLDELRLQTPQSQSERLEKARIKSEVLKQAYKHLARMMQSAHQDLVQRLQTETEILVRKFGTTTVQEITLDQQLNMLVRQHNKVSPFVRLTVSEQLRIKLAFHLSLITLRVKSGIGRHPALLILDAPVSKDLDGQIMDGIVQALADTQFQYGGDLQILLATANDLFTTVCGADQIESRESGEFFF